ncbi:MAG: helix-turn-helix domain-containing protein [Acidobacteriota bacterium]|nr:helix-turn-helix domain-containing protein [Acidobacteriota bacterium]
MHKIVSVSPGRELKEYVRAFAQREIDCATAEIVQPVLACLEPTIELDFCHSPLIEYDTGSSETASPISIVGPHTSRLSCIRLKSPIDSFGIFFQPLGLWQLFRIPMGLLVNQAYTGHDVFGNSIRRLWEQMAETASFDERVRLAEEYLLRSAANVFCRTSVMNSAHYLFRQQGETRIDALASHAALSVRQFERRFSEEIGMPPKLFARIARYQMALDAKVTSPGRSWLEIAHDFGYYDQMHMIKDFQDLCGSTPGRALIQLGDMRPEALAAPLNGT